MIDRATEQRKLDFHSTNITANGTNGTNTNQELNLDFYLGVYAGMLMIEVRKSTNVDMLHVPPNGNGDLCILCSSGLTGATIIFGFMRSLFMFNALVSSAETLHNRMFNSILRTPVRFFDINPIGEYKNT